MKTRGYLSYGIFVVAACAALGVLLWQRQSAKDAEDAQKYPPQQVVHIPPASPSLPPGGGPAGPPPGAQPYPGPLPPGSGPVIRGGGPTPIPFRADGSGRPPFMGGVKQEPVIDLNAAPVSALVTLPGITEEYAKKIVAHRPYRDRTDLEEKTGLPHSVVEKLGPPAMIRSTSTEPFPARGRGRED